MTRRRFFRDTIIALGATAVGGYAAHKADLPEEDIPSSAKRDSVDNVAVQLEQVRDSIWDDYDAEYQRSIWHSPAIHDLALFSQPGKHDDQ